MTSDFVKLGVLASQKGAIVSGPFGSNIGRKFFRESGVPLIRGNNLSIGCYPYFKEEGFVFITEEKADELKNCTSIKGDIILTAAGTIGQTGMITSAQKFPKYIISNKQIRIRVDSEISDSLFVYYWLSSPDMNWVIESYNSGSTVPLINLSSVRRFPIPNFPLQTQEKISGLLSLIDSAIISFDLTSKNLESYISLLFRSWFIDFDPVKAKVDGKFPYGMDEETAALFPDSFEDSEIGLIPKGWTLQQLSDFADVIDCSRGQREKPEQVDSGFGTLLHVWNIENDGGINFSKTYEVTEKDFEIWASRILLSEGDCVMTKTGRVAAIGRISRHMNRKLALGRNMIGIRSLNAPSFTYAYLKSPLKDSEVMRWMLPGTVMPALHVSMARRLSVIVPSKDILAKFEEIVKPLICLIDESRAKNILLSNCRDALLPRLMSGELKLN